MLVANENSTPATIESISMGSTFSTTGEKEREKKGKGEGEESEREGGE
jgi:hypothetical protein